jgi:S1-C subfamily serine protease
VVLAERPILSARESAAPAKPAPPKTADPRGNTLRLGVTLAELTPQLLAERRLTGVQGLFVKDIDPNGLVAELRVPPAGRQPLDEGDVINRINRTPVTSLADFQRVLSSLKAGDPIVLNVTRVDPRSARQVPLIVQFTYQ